MATITFDTLKFVHRLRDAGVPEPQAEAFAEAFKDASGEAELATRADVSRLETSAKTDLRLEIGTVRAEIANAKNEILRWMIPLFLAQMGLLVGLLIKMH